MIFVWGGGLITMFKVEIVLNHSKVQIEMSYKHDNYRYGVLQSRTTTKFGNRQFLS